MSKNYEQYQEYIEKIASKFYDAIQNNNVPWEKEWSAKELKINMAHNPTTKTVYKNLNSLSLDIEKENKNYVSNVWLTFKQAKELGGHVRKGEKSSSISFFKIEKKTEELELEDVKQKGVSSLETIETEKPVFKKSYVFNLDQIDGISKEKVEELKFKANQNIKTLENFNDHKKCEKILKKSGIPIVHTKDSKRAFYRPMEDKIYMPEKSQFKSEAAYYSTALHELGHATGHESRLNRKFGASKAGLDYAKEELRAEIYSYLQAKDLGIDYNLQNHQSYVKSWQKGLQNSKEEIVNAVKDAVKMVSYVKENYQERTLENTKSHKIIQQMKNEQANKRENER